MAQSGLYLIIQQMQEKVQIFKGEGAFSLFPSFPVSFVYTLLFFCLYSSWNQVSGDIRKTVNFSQRDLTAEDVLVLDCHSDIYVWEGHHSPAKSKHQALTQNQKFLGMENSLKQHRLQTPLYVVTEGSEPPFFTCFFQWGSLKGKFFSLQMLCNSLEQKLAILKGKSEKLEGSHCSFGSLYST
ncbi:unnamed protein product [Coffea canephora]|uniref:Gelsolin-like domain-containing protein n=1 Tax=Coffea canephora TaxID=49390 RepID=A0A068V7E6_COFCA|nr:unnamed protein product [Coffea canephora]